MGASVALAEARSAAVEELDGTPVVIAGETFWIGELTIDQTVAVARTLGAELASVPVADGVEIRDGLEAAVKDGADAAAKAQSGISFMMKMVTADAITGLASALLDKDLAWCRKNVRLNALVAISVAVYEHNDWQALAGLFPKAAPEPVSATSPPSSAEQLPI